MRVEITEADGSKRVEWLHGDLHPADHMAYFLWIHNKEVGWEN